MAKPYGEISKTEFDKTYNVVEVYTDINSIIAMLKTFNPKTQAIALGQKKKPRDTMPQWFKQWNDEVYEKKQPQWFKT
ncbi:MAG: hypothetical protein MJ233_00850 [Mycoplasmoidaceae bacterium]|nr:hypothetical protein [Mycoplasmoidaceae bacterium]